MPLYDPAKGSVRLAAENDPSSATEDATLPRTNAIGSSLAAQPVSNVRLTMKVRR
jgi:hypothetical protein